MSRLSFDELNSVGAPLDQIGYRLFLGSLPGVGNADKICIQCTNVMWPGVSNQAFEVGAAGHTVKARGKHENPRTLSATFFENQEMSIFNDLARYHKFVVDAKSGNSADYKERYSIRPALKIYDTTGKEVNSVSFINFFIQDLPDITFDGSSSAAVMVQATFSYDLAYYDLVDG